MNTIAKKHHYVPQFILRNFSEDGNQIQVFDKQTDNCFRSSIKNIGCENGFYSVKTEFEGDEYTLSLEPGLAMVDGSGAKVIKKIIKDESLQGLTDQQYSELVVFTVIQRTRGHQARDLFRDISSGLAEKVRSMGLNPYDMKGFSEDESAIKDSAIRSLLDKETVLELSNIIFSKHLYLLKAPESHPFIIGDNPISIDNTTGSKHSFFGNLELVSEGIEIYFPISSSLCLAFYCPSITDQTQAGALSIMCLFLDQPNTIFPSKLIESGNHAFNILRAHKDKTALNIFDPENVVRLNSLQVIHASRFLYAESDSFQIARRMIADNEKFRGRGRKMSFG